ncbi:hypothetical protein DMENIID0001_157590 [Sergentomyia squamirostris]
MEPSKKKMKLEEQEEQEEQEDLQKSPQKSILELNDDCLEEIFSYFSIEELVEVDKVCPRFQNVAEEYFYRKQKVLKVIGELHRRTQIADLAERMGPYVSTLKINDADLRPRFTYLELFSILQPLYMKCINLEHLFIKEIDLRTHLPFLKSIFKTLKTAKLVNCKLTARIGICLKNASNLESLSLVGELRIFVKFIPALKCQLKELDLRGWSNIYEGPYFADFCRGNQKLESLAFSFKKNTPESVMSNLNELKNLQKLYIQNPDCAPATTIVPVLARLTHLTIEDYQLQRSQGIHNMIVFIDHIKDSVEYLTVSVQYAEESTQILKKFTRLKFLKNVMYHWNDSNLANININCRRTLEELHIINSRFVTDTGLLQLLKDCSNLKTLNLRNCSKISNDLIIGLLPFLKERSHSLEIWVHGTNITRAIQEVLQLCGNQKIKLNWEE